MQGESLVVEFFGIPGVGKSHVARIVAAQLAATGTPTRSAALTINNDLAAWRRITTKCIACVAELLRHPRRSWRVTDTFRRTDQTRRKDVARLSFNWLALSALVRRARTRPSVELLDEGAFQILWAAGLTGREGAIGTCAPLLRINGRSGPPVPDVVVLVEAPLEMVYSRLTLRKSRLARIDRMSARDQTTALLRGQGLVTEILADEIGLVDRSSAPALRRVRNDRAETLDTDVNELVRELVSLMG